MACGMIGGGRLAALLLGAVLLLDLGLYTSSFPVHPFRKRWYGVPGSAEAGQEAGKRAQQSNLTRWLTQKLDHLDENQSHTFNQRYFVNESFWRGPGGPVFLCVGGEGPPLSEQVVVTGEEHCALMIALAQRHGALILALEHRFYGLSIPTANLTTSSLKYLSSVQALADIGLFHSFITSTYNLGPGVRWMSFGGSYPGMLAAWTRTKMPDLFWGAVSSSAPVEAIFNMRGYNDVVAQAFKDYDVGGSAECLHALEVGFQQLGFLLESAIGKRQLEAMFNVCGDKVLDSKDNLKLFAGLISDIFIPQSNDPACSEAACNIEKQCQMLLDPTMGKQPLDRIAKVNQAMEIGQCMMSDWKNVVDALTNTTNEGGTARIWFYQTCNEFAFYQTCDPESSCPFTTSPHVNDLQSYVDQCMLAFNISGEQIQKSVASTNAYYQGRKPSATGILSVNGDVDPWHAQAILHSRPGLPAFMVRGASHHFWTHPAKPTDSQPIRHARKRIAEWVAGRLYEGNRDIDTVAVL